MHVMNVQRQKIQVVVRPVDNDSKVAAIEREMESNDCDRLCDAGISIADGSLQHCRNPSGCLNWGMEGPSDHLTPYCKRQRYYEQRLERDMLAFRRPLLEFYWGSRCKTDAGNFLRESGLVTSFESALTCPYR